MGLPAVITGKCCSKCGVWKPFEYFTKHSRTRDGLQSNCKTCHVAQFNAWKRRNPRTYHEHVKLTNARRRTLKREYQLMHKYGITIQQFDQMIVDQDGRCMLCLIVFDELKPCVDHCHDTGHVRGLLCTHCNRCLHCAENDPAWLDRAKEYLCAA